jgi:hypothetical protein
MTLLILPAVVQLVLNRSETPHISASLEFDTIQAIVRQFGQPFPVVELHIKGMFRDMSIREVDRAGEACCRI